MKEIRKIIDTTIREAVKSRIAQLEERARKAKEPPPPPKKSVLDLAQEHAQACAEAARTEAAAADPGACLVSFKPMLSNALAFHPKQVEEARRVAKRHGQTVDILPDGHVRVTSSRQFREYAKKNGMTHLGY